MTRDHDMAGRSDVPEGLLYGAVAVRPVPPTEERLERMDAYIDGAFPLPVRPSPDFDRRLLRRDAVRAWLKERVRTPVDVRRGTEVAPPECASEYGGYYWRCVRALVLIRDDRTCAVCGVRDDLPDGGLHVHHVHPRQYGGADDPANLIVLCDACHRRIHKAMDARMAVVLDGSQTTMDDLTAEGGV